ncbi:hypothetical protein QTO34_009403 [Cnephaeus nilssonii]|uniref:Nucleoredoxin n=1 Tax=Cnephaeus nilssonii TaxID=3371016 RepID=A0AA40HHW3_CNENI|nr:hypothetical protein QTO34_009403 [Eptesicus nilssonii]
MEKRALLSAKGSTVGQGEWKREGKTERNIDVRETHRLVASCTSPDQGPGLGGACNRDAPLKSGNPKCEGERKKKKKKKANRLQKIYINNEPHVYGAFVFRASPHTSPHLQPTFIWEVGLLRQLKLWNKYRISNIPSLIFLDATTGKVVCRNGLLVIRDDPEGLEFPWGPKPFREVIAGPLLRNNGQSLESSSLEGSHVGVYFSAHWCPPCRSLTRVLVESYRKIKEAGQKFEIIFVSADRSEDSFKQYFSEMPWLAVPYTDEARRSRLNRLYGIQGIPTLIVLDPQGEVITRQGRVEVLNDEDCREFPWHPKPVLELSDSNAVQLNEGPCLVLFVDSEDDGESEAAKQLIQPIAEKIIAKYKAKEEEAPLLFFVAGEDDMTDSLRDYTNLPEAAPLLTILDMSARAKYVMDVEEITPAIVEAFVNDFLAEKLKPEPI